MRYPMEMIYIDNKEPVKKDTDLIVTQKNDKPQNKKIKVKSINDLLKNIPKKHPEERLVIPETSKLDYEEIFSYLGSSLKAKTMYQEYIPYGKKSKKQEIVHEDVIRDETVTEIIRQTKSERLIRGHEYGEAYLDKFTPKEREKYRWWSMLNPVVSQIRYDFN